MFITHQELRLPLPSVSFSLIKEGIIRDYIEEQISRCYNFETHFLKLGEAKDPLTLAARLYEATRLPDYKLFLKNKL